MKIITLDQIKAVLDVPVCMEAIREGFIAYSSGKAQIPPVGHLVLPDGDCHIKYGCIEGDAFFVIKVASGSYTNVSKGLPSSSGMMMVFSLETGFPLALLQDEGYLTDLRTAMAGYLAAQHLAPAEVKCIGILGAGIQARLQLEYLQHLTDCRKVTVWNRNQGRAEAFAAEMAAKGYDVRVVNQPKSVAQACNLIVTTTPSTQPLLYADDIQPGTHITAMGADSPGKGELDPHLLAKADLRVVDSRSQCITQGECQHAVEKGLIEQGSLLELGTLLADQTLGRQEPDQITFADLTGVAVQDICIAAHVYKSCL